MNPGTIIGPATMSESLAPELEEPYRRLLRVLRAGRGMFTLVPVESNLAAEEREHLFEHLRQDLAAEGLSLCGVELDYNHWDPVEVIEEARGLDMNEHSVLLLCGLERTPPGSPTLDGLTRPPAFARLNQTREMLEQSYPVPTVVWCDPHTYDTLRRHAPDFFDHFSGLVRFLVSREESDGRSHQEMDLQHVEASGTRGGMRSAAAVRFYEELLEHPSLSDEEKVRALLGLAEALVDRSAAEGVDALEKAAECAAQAIGILSPEIDLAAWSRAHFLHACALGPLGQPERALESAQRAVEGCRELSRSDSSPVGEQIAKSLVILSNCLGALGRREEGLAAIQEAVDIRRRLAERRPDDFLPDLALSLNNLSVDLGDLGRGEEGLTAIQEAVDLYRRLAERRPDAFLPGLAMSLNNHSVRLAELGRREEGLAAIQEAVDVYRRLAARRPEAFLPDLATGLNNLSVQRGDLGRGEEGLAAIQEAVDLFRRVAEERPDAFLPDLARSLGAQGRLLSQDDQPAAALAAIREALDHLDPFFRRQPSAFAPLMTAIVQDYEQAMSACGEPPDSPRLEAIGETLRRVQEGARAAAERPGRSLPRGDAGGSAERGPSGREN